LLNIPLQTTEPSFAFPALSEQTASEWGVVGSTFASEAGTYRSFASVVGKSASEADTSGNFESEADTFVSEVGTFGRFVLAADTADRYRLV
jgi:hypothetical protein